MDCAVLAQPYNHVSFKRRKNTWYTIASGNWSDPNIWMSNSHRRYNFPQNGDDVSIGFGYTVTCNTTASLNNLYVAGSLIFDSTARTITLAGDIQATGSVNMSNAAHNLILNGVNNYIATFTSGTTATVTYGRSGDQFVMNQSYRNITFNGYGTKYLTSNLTIAGNVSLLATTGVNTLEFSTYDLTVTGSTTTFTGSILSKTGAGSLLFVGQLNNAQNVCVVNFSGNPDIEFRGGYSQGGSSGNSYNFGTGNISITTNSQTFNNSGGVTVPFTNVTIVGVITTTITGIGPIQVNNFINGSVAGSTLINKGVLNLNTSTLPMVTGTFDFTNFTNTIAYVFDGDYTLPFSSYRSLTVSGTGTKTTPANLSLQENLAISNGTIELSSFDITVGGTTNFGPSGILSKSSTGAVVFGGQVQFAGNNGGVSFTGNPSVEFKGGVSIFAPILVFNFGTSGIIFSTNNQTIQNSGNSSITANITSPVLISGAITLTVTHTSVTALVLVLTNAINGNNAASTLDNRETIQYQATQQPMLTGILQTNAAANTFIYNKAGDQDVKGGTYRTLTLAGNGIKTLQGNVVVATLYTLTPPATLNTNGFTRT